MRQETASAVCMAVCYHLRYSSICVQYQFERFRSLGGQKSPRLVLWLTMKTLEQGAGGHNPPVSLQGSYPERLQNLSLIDSISYLLLATELDKDVVQSYLASLATPNQLIQLTMCCSQAQPETAAKPASKAAARRVWTTADKGNKARLDATTATSSAGVC